jgi:hypothetical protein
MVRPRRGPRRRRGVDLRVDLLENRTLLNGTPLEDTSPVEPPSVPYALVLNVPDPGAECQSDEGQQFPRDPEAVPTEEGRSDEGQQPPGVPGALSAEEGDSGNGDPSSETPEANPAESVDRGQDPSDEPRVGPAIPARAHSGEIVMDAPVLPYAPPSLGSMRGGANPIRGADELGSISEDPDAPKSDVTGNNDSKFLDKLLSNLGTDFIYRNSDPQQPGALVKWATSRWRLSDKSDHDAAHILGEIKGNLPEWSQTLAMIQYRSLYPDFLDDSVSVGPPAGTTMSWTLYPDSLPDSNIRIS